MKFKINGIAEKYLEVKIQDSRAIMDIGPYKGIFHGVEGKIESGPINRKTT